MLSFLRNKRFVPQTIGLILTLLGLVLVLQSAQLQWLKRLDYLFYDMRFNATLALQESPALEHNIAIVDIDEASLAQEGHWPWSRHRLADLVHNLAAMGAAVIGFDVVFSEAERNPVLELKRLLPQAASIPLEWKDEVDADHDFANSFAATDVVLGNFFLDQDNIHIGQLPNPVWQLNKTQKDKLVVIEKPGYVASLPILKEQAGGGFVTTFADLDGVVRRTPLVIKFQDSLYPSLSLKMVMKYLLIDDLNLETSQIGDALAVRSITVGDKNARTDAVGRVTVPFRGGGYSFPYYSAKDVLNQTLAANALDNAIVLVGTSSIGLADLRATPVGTQYPGVEVHANVIEGLLTGHFSYRPEWEIGATVTQLLIIGCLLALVLPRLEPLAAIGLSVFMATLVVLGNYYLWAVLKLDLPLAMQLLLTLTLAVFNMSYGFLIENANRRALRGMFDQYVPPAHIEKMMNSPDDYVLTGESKELTVLFSDVRSFTSISEKLTAHELKQLLNQYFTPITKCIFDYDGTVDKYVGDMVMAFWGAPIDDEHHAHKAVACALEMQAILATLRLEFAQKSWPEIRAGIGLNTGDMNVGDMGSAYRRAYTVLGDAVNLGSRLESLTKYYGVEILVSESTKNQAANFIYRYIDCIQVKGKSEPVNVFEPLGKTTEITPSTLEEINQFNQAIHLYKNKQWQQAVQQLLQLKAQNPLKLYDIYLERIAQLQEQELPDGWNGVFTHTEK
ncbi:MAG: adenylate/guanylate cyclase domain-containing protein [Venatoribacter sp.]